MKQSITFSHFTDAFRDMGRDEQFSYAAQKLLFDWFEQYDEDCGTETELDVIAICCEFSEEDSDDIADNYNIDLSDCEDDDERHDAVEEYLLENTSLIGQTNVGNFVYQAF